MESKPIEKKVREKNREKRPDARPNVSVHMLRQGLDDFPHYQLPVGYTFRTYRPGDEVVWIRLQRAAEPFFTIEDDLFHQQFGQHPHALLDRMFFVETASGEPVATITAWWQENWQNRGQWGQIHWVAVHPRHQRQGISKAMMTRAMQRLARDHWRAMLGTSSGRIWAIKVYLDFGFHPDVEELHEEKIREAWRTLQAELAHPLLGEYL